MDRERVIALMERRNWDNRKLADALGISEDKVSKSLSTTAAKPRRWQGDEVARLHQLEAEDNPVVRTEVRGTGLTPEDLARLHSPDQPSKPLPLLGTARGGDWDGLEDVEMTELRLSDVLDYLRRPPSLANDDEAYAVEIVGDSMTPRFEPGERAYVSPRAPVRPGDDVIVQLVTPGAEGDVADMVTDVLIKRLVRMTSSSIELRQFNPDRTFQVPLERVARKGRRAIHRVVGRL